MVLDYEHTMTSLGSLTLFAMIGRRFDMKILLTLNYRVIVKRYPFPNGVVGSLIPALKSSPYLMEKLARYVGSQEPTHYKVGNKPHPAPRGLLSRGGPTTSNSRRIAQCWLYF